MPVGLLLPLRDDGLELRLLLPRAEDEVRHGVEWQPRENCLGDLVDAEDGVDRAVRACVVQQPAPHLVSRLRLAVVARHSVAQDTVSVSVAVHDRG